MKLELRGADQCQRRLQRIADAKQEIAEATVRTGCRVMTAACKADAPGSTKQEIGYGVKQEGDKTIGRAGVVRFPRRGQRGKGPHLIYLDRGTRYITARRYIAQALARSRSRALAAMRAAAKRKIRSIAKP